MRYQRRLVLLAIPAFVLSLSTTWISLNAQTETPGPALLSLQSSATDVQTGQEYAVNVQVDNVSELWLADLQIQYDPKLIYVIGTKAGSPVKPGSFLAPADSTAVVQDTVAAGSLSYTVSMLAPANPVAGSGSIGSFQVYPLAAGTTQITFTKADLLKVHFATDDSGPRV